MNRHFVHIYATVRVKIAVDGCADHAAAIDAADNLLSERKHQLFDRTFCEESSLAEPSSPGVHLVYSEADDEATGFLVDEAGDGDFTNSREYGPDGRSPIATPCNTPPPPPDEYLGSFEYELIADALDVLDPDGSAATNRAQELAAWARAMAATGRGYLPPSTGKPLRVLVALEGGCVSAVIINRPGVELITLDYDTEGSDEADLFDIPQDGGDTAQAWRTIGECEQDEGGFFERARDARPSDPEGRLAMLRSNAASLGEAVGQSDYGRGLQREIAELERGLASEEADATA
jgi:hypothetical protein